jgi:hypothetical protein
VAFIGLAACDTTVPDSGAGVGFGDYATYQQQQAAREAQLRGQAVPPAQAISGETVGAGAPMSATGTTGTAEGDLAKETEAVLAATRANSGTAPVNASPSNPPPVQLNNPGISDENDFGAVGARRSRQDDAALRAAQAAQYEQIQPTALPSRAGSGGPSIVEYALSTSHPVGASRYKRVGLNLQARYQTNCAKYPSPDLAQQEFLEKGGPDKDRLGLDPDGDGYACSWDPAPFRTAKNG